MLFGLLALAMMAGIFWMSGRAVDQVVRDVPVPPNLLHIFAFGAIAYAWSRALDRHGQSAGLLVSSGRLAFLITAAFGLSDEVHQEFTEGRTCSFYDLVADAAGAVVVLLLPWLGRSGRPRSVWPAVAVFVAAAALAIVSGSAHVPGDGAIRVAIRLLRHV